MRAKIITVLSIVLSLCVCNTLYAHPVGQDWRALSGLSFPEFFSLQELQFVVRLFVALLLGLICGFSHGAGTSSVTISIKTFAAVCLGAATFTAVMIHVNYLTHIPNILNGIGNIITGIGFVCAAVIFKKGASVAGLSTAATLWTAAGIGMACGSAMYGIAVTVTVIIAAFHFLPGKSSITMSRRD
jgi:uncharacterized membrane protein YhiD involved in acid resistance